jgi:hypothetical protein
MGWDIVNRVGMTLQETTYSNAVETEEKLCLECFKMFESIIVQMSKITSLGARGNNNGTVLLKVKTESVWKCSFAFTGSRINNLLNDTKIENSV